MHFADLCHVESNCCDNLIKEAGLDHINVKTRHLANWSYGPHKHNGVAGGKWKTMQRDVFAIIDAELEDETSLAYECYKQYEVRLHRR